MFFEQLLPSNINKQAQFGPRYATTVVQMDSGAEQRVQHWSQPLYEGEIGYNPRNTSEAATWFAIFRACKGQAFGFRFFHLADYDEGGTPQPLWPLTATTFQLQKGYTIWGQTDWRPITKPISNTLGDTAATQADSTVHLFQLDGVTEIASGWTIDCTTGIVTFASAPGFVPLARFQFHVPVRFASDKMVVVQEDVGVVSWEHVPIVEIRNLS